MKFVDAKTETPNEYRQVMTVRSHTFAADYSETDSAPGPHDLFDASLAACKSITAHWYAKRNNLPLERVETHIERDETDERKGVYRLTVHVELFGDLLTEEQRAKIQAAIAHCPVHKLMTTTDAQITTV